MFSHSIEFEQQFQYKTSHYKIELKFNGDVVKTVYINAQDKDCNRNMQQVIEDFYIANVPEYKANMEKWLGK